MQVTSDPRTNRSPGLAADWPLPSQATLGSSVRAKGIERELRRRLPLAVRGCVTVAAGGIALRMNDDDADAFEATSERIAALMETLVALPVFPSEAEDILAISSRERHKWMKDGLLLSAGTRTVKLRGRAKAVTFHIFDPGHIEEVLDGDLPAIWREQDARTRVENRRRAARKTAQSRAGRGAVAAGPGPTGGVLTEKAKTGSPDAGSTTLDGWDAFVAEGLLR